MTKNRKAKIGGKPKYITLIRNWAHQGFFYLDKTEMFYRVIWEIIPVVLLIFFLNFNLYISFFISFLIIHTYNWVANDNFWAVFIHSMPKQKNPGEALTIEYLLNMQNRLAKTNSISAIKKIEPWDENYFRAQDFEYTLRFSKKHKLVSIPYSMGIHHTQLYAEREFSFFKNGHSMYMGNIIFNNLNKFSNIRELLRRNRGPMTGLLFYMLVILTSVFQLDFKCYFFPLSLFSFDIIIGLIKNKNIKNYIIENYISSIFIFFGFFYIKKRKLKYNITEIK